jgi:hypothetical protein
VEGILKSDARNAKALKGSTIQVFDPREKFYHDQHDLIAAEVISFVEQRYPTKAPPIRVGDRLIFFLADAVKSSDIPLAGAYPLIVGQAYDTTLIKQTVLKLVQ